MMCRGEPMFRRLSQGQSESREIIAAAHSGGDEAGPIPLSTPPSPTPLPPEEAV